MTLIHEDAFTAAAEDAADAAFALDTAEAASISASAAASPQIIRIENWTAVALPPQSLTHRISVIRGSNVLKVVFRSFEVFSVFFFMWQRKTRKPFIMYF